MSKQRPGIHMAAIQIPLLLLGFLHWINDGIVTAQQAYVDNKQLDCYNKNPLTYGFLCNGLRTSCLAYLTFRTYPPYDSPATVASLLASDAILVTSLNGLASPRAILPPDSLLLVPVNCSCSGPHYQHNASYILRSQNETYFTLANNTYAGLTTCQALMAQNPFGDRNLHPGLAVRVPLMCACPTSYQTARSFRFLLSYLVTWRDSISAIASLFGVSEQSVLHANNLSAEDSIYPFTTVLVPLPSTPTKIRLRPSSPPAAPSPLLPTLPASSPSPNHKWVFAGIGIGTSLLLLALCALLLRYFRRRKIKTQPMQPPVSASHTHSARQSWGLPSGGIPRAVESLMVYRYEGIQNATANFSESHYIKGSVFRGSFNRDCAAIKIMKGDVTGEINILKQLNHSNIIRLSGFCLHQGNTYLVYEYAEKGSLADWIPPAYKNNHSSKDYDSLSWQQRVGIARDIADALNYLHSYTNPPYIHKNLKSSNILLDANFRAKLANFGLARRADSASAEGIQLTRHVVGTQGYMAPEYIENGVITPKLDVFAFGVVLLELLSGREASDSLSATIKEVLQGDKVREKLRSFMDPALGDGYPLELAFSMADLARSCVAHDINFRPTVSQVFMTLSKILSSSLDCDPSQQLETSS